MEYFDAVYRQTSYIVDDGSARFMIRLDAPNESLHGFLAERRAKTWSFLTAFNPFGKALSMDENTGRQADLIILLDDSDYEHLCGLGVGDDPSWEPEPSIFVLDISRDAAIALGKTFSQNAILWGKVDRPAELIWCV